MSAPKLRAFLSAVEPNGTVVVRLDRFGNVTTIETIQTTMRRMRNAYFSCVDKSLALARSDDELFDMMMLSARATTWLKRCCSELEKVKTTTREVTP